MQCEDIVAILCEISVCKMFLYLMHPELGLSDLSAVAMI